MKRAAIYIRVSTEKQSEKVSPEAQEADCRSYCESHDYQVFDIYKDTEKYKYNGRMVEPSGTRADRPQLRRMFKDANDGMIDVIVAWRMDRISRGLNMATVEISNLVKAKKVDVELVKETFDRKTFEILAWAAGQDNEARRDRFYMGMHGRLAAKKIWCSVPPYGYKRENDELVIDEIEAGWVVNIWQWYGAGVGLYEIRRRIIQAGLPQRRKNNKYNWERSIIRKILKNDCYFTGIFTIKWDGKVYDLPVPTIIDETTYQAVRDRLAKFHAYPVTNLKVEALAAGKVYCAVCGCKMKIAHTTVGGKTYLYYRCWNDAHQLSKPGCPHSLHIQDFDRDLWARVWRHISVPGVFEDSVQKKINEIRAEEKDADAECERLERELQESGFERDKVITWARQGRIKDSDLDKQLAALDIQDIAMQKELNTWKLMTGGRAERLEGLIRDFRARTSKGIRILESEPDTPVKAEKIFKAKRAIIQEIVTKIDVFSDKTFEVYTEFDFPSVYWPDDIHADGVLGQ